MTNKTPPNKIIKKILTKKVIEETVEEANKAQREIMNTPPNKIIEFAVSEENTEYVESIRVYNVKIPLDFILNEKTVKKEIAKALAQQRKEYEKCIQDEIAQKNKDCHQIVKEEKEATKNILLKEIEEGLPKEKKIPTYDFKGGLVIENKKGYNQYRQEVKEFLKKIC